VAGVIEACHRSTTPTFPEGATMPRTRHLPISPATVIALIALFFALGGSAFAVGQRVERAAVAQQRCANGAVRGIAWVTGDPSAGAANIPDQFSSNKKLFGRVFNCSGRAVQVRRVAPGTFEVRFVGNAAASAVASAANDSYADAEPVAGGAFRVTVHPAGRDDKADSGFTIVVV
jgi:hypothetical protein